MPRHNSIPIEDPTTLRETIMHRLLDDGMPFLVTELCSAYDRTFTGDVTLDSVELNIKRLRSEVHPFIRESLAILIVSVDCSESSRTRAFLIYDHIDCMPELHTHHCRTALKHCGTRLSETSYRRRWNGSEAGHGVRLRSS